MFSLIDLKSQKEKKKDVENKTQNYHWLIQILFSISNN